MTGPRWPSPERGKRELSLPRLLLPPIHCNPQTTTGSDPDKPPHHRFFLSQSLSLPQVLSFSFPPCFSLCLVLLLSSSQPTVVASIYDSDGKWDITYKKKHLRGHRIRGGQLLSCQSAANSGHGLRVGNRGEATMKHCLQPSPPPFLGANPFLLTSSS